jgi:hypothetical protein
LRPKPCLGPCRLQQQCGYTWLDACTISSFWQSVLTPPQPSSLLLGLLPLLLLQLVLLPLLLLLLLLLLPLLLHGVPSHWSRVLPASSR